MGFIEDYLNSSISTLFGVKLRLILATRLLWRVTNGAYFVSASLSEDKNISL